MQSASPKAKSVLDVFLQYAPAFHALSLYDDIKEWVNGQRRRPEEIFELAEAARRVADSTAGRSSYQAQWTYAFALKYCREYAGCAKRIIEGYNPEKGRTCGLQAVVYEVE